MTCVHRVKWSVKRPEDCRFRLSVSHYKDRIVAPDEYSGVTEVTPSDETQILPTKDKLVRDDITIFPASEPDLRPLSVSENGQYSPDGFDGYSEVTVDVEPALGSLLVTENGLYLPTAGVDGYDRVNVDVPTLNLNEIADQSAVYGDVVLDSATKIRAYFFNGANVNSVVAPLATEIGDNAFNGSTLTSGKFVSCTSVGEETFRNVSSFGANSNFIDDFPVIESTALYSFGGTGFVDIIIPASYKGATRNYSFAGCTHLERVRFLGTPTTLMNGAFGANNRLTDVYVPWSEGEVANAPWGASRATIHYNTVYDSEYNVVSSS